MRTTGYHRVNNLYVQYGCGLSAPVGWLNFDASPTLRFERIPLIGRLYTMNVERFPTNVRYGDIVKGLPIEAGSCRGIYCSHILEHLALDDCDRALANTFRYLQRGGTFRMVVPDLEQLCRDYLSDSSSTAAHRFMEVSYLGRKQRPRGIIGLIKERLGNSAHLWMWDERSMVEKLKEHGFTQIRRCTFGDAADQKFREVEEKLRFDGCLAIQCSN